MGQERLGVGRGKGEWVRVPGRPLGRSDRETREERKYLLVDRRLSVKTSGRFTTEKKSLELECIE